MRRASQTTPLLDLLKYSTIASLAGCPNAAKVLATSSNPNFPSLTVASGPPLSSGRKGVSQKTPFEGQDEGFEGLKYRATVFDVDGVLLTFKSSWEFVHKSLGTSGSLDDMKKYFRGEISYEEWCRRDWERWKSAKKDLTREDVLRIMERVVDYVHPNAANSVNLVKRRGMAVGLLSAGLEASTAKVAELLGVHLWLANPCYECKPVVEPKNKALGLKKLLEKLDIGLKEVIYVGDSLIDVPAMLASGCSIGVRDPQIKKFSTVWIEDLSLFEEALLQCVNHPSSVKPQPDEEQHKYRYGEGEHFDWVGLLDLD
ncbi:TPA: HAD-IB family phosphatase [Desulfurococcaceae archaeon]|nr:HAD-IB family phosphatase [Desulfurococcaceae archaeon]